MDVKTRFRCYVWRQDDQYYAECLDLTLLTKRPTMQEAMEALEEAILCHIEAAQSRGWQDDLVPRLAPLHRWWGFYWRLFVHALSALFLGHLDGFMAYEVRLVGEGSLVYA